jgi:hypothetical protein
LQTTGIIIGLAAFLSIGVFHPIVIWTEYYFSKRVWPVFLVLGSGFLILSALTDSLILASVLGIWGFSCWWSIKELFEQEQRVARGWFPANPRRK